MIRKKIRWKFRESIHEKFQGKIKTRSKDFPTRIPSTIKRKVQDFFSLLSGKWCSFTLYTFSLFVPFTTDMLWPCFPSSCLVPIFFCTLMPVHVNRCWSRLNLFTLKDVALPDTCGQDTTTGHLLVTSDSFGIRRPDSPESFRLFERSHVCIDMTTLLLASAALTMTSSYYCSQIY